MNVLPVEYFYDREVLVEKVMIPPDVKKGEKVNINVVIRASEPTRGTLQIVQKADNASAPAPGNEQPQPVELDRGVNVFTLKQLINEPNFYTFSAEFNPEKGSGDRRAINNKAEGFTHARGKAQVLLIEGTAGEHAELVKALREKEIEVKVLVAPRIDGSGGVGGDPLPIDLAQLQPYDSVILANVPKEAFTETQHQLLASNCHDMGAGLVMLGGPDSFGAGGWMNTPVEKALPVDMQIKALKVQGIGAMVLIMHASEIAEGNYWQKVVAKAAISSLSSYDYAGMLHWEGQEAWLFTLRAIGTGRGSMLRAVDRMTPGDMPDFDPSLQMAMKGLNGVKDAMSKHIVIISDGDPTPPSNRVISQLAASKITVTAVLTAAHGNDPGAMSIMRNLALRTKGRFYNVTNPRALPRIYQKEARSISRPLIFEQGTPWLPKLNYPITEPIMGLPEQLPAITGLVLTSPKENELVEIPLRLSAAGRPGQPAAGPLDLRPGPLGRLHQRCRSAVDQGLGRLAELRRLLVPGHPLVDATGRPGQSHPQRPARGGADQGRRRRPGQGEPVPQLPADPGERGQPRPEVGAGGAGPDRAGPLRDDHRERRLQRQLLRQPRLSRAE